MGAELVVDVIKGKTSAEAYNTAVQEARYEAGSGGYTGTIAESRGHRMIPVRAAGISAREAELYSNDAVKWEHTLMAPRVDDKTLSARSATVKLPLKGDVESFVRTWMRDNPTKVVLDYKVVNTTKTAKGAVKPQAGSTKYVVMNQANTDGNTPYVWREFSTPAEARRFAREQARKGVSVSLVTTAREEFQAITTRTEAVEITTKTVIKSTRARKGEFWAMGLYSS